MACGGGFSTSTNTDFFASTILLKDNSALFQCTSDIRTKQNVAPADLRACLDSLLGIRLRVFQYTADYLNTPIVHASAPALARVPQLGCIADELAENHPDAVRSIGSLALANGTVLDNFLTVNLSRQIYELIGAIQYLDEQIALLEARLLLVA